MNRGRVLAGGLLVLHVLLVQWGVPAAAGLGGVAEFPIPTATSISQEIVLGPDGNLWFTEQTADRIGRITPAGVVTEFTVPASRGRTGITVGPDGNIWFPC